MTNRTLHTLKDLRGRTIHQWLRWPRFEDIQAEVAEWADCDPDAVEIFETPGGDFYGVGNVPYAYMDRELIEIIDLRPMIADIRQTVGA